MSDIQITQQVSWSQVKQGNVFQAINRIMSLFGNFTVSRTSPAITAHRHTTPLLSKRGPGSGPQRRVVTSPAKFDEALASRPHAAPVGRSASLSSIPFENVDTEVVRLEGLRHANGKLEAR